MQESFILDLEMQRQETLTHQWVRHYSGTEYSCTIFLTTASSRVIVWTLQKLGLIFQKQQKKQLLLSVETAKP